MSFFDFMTEEIAIDLGTANTLIIHQDKVVVDEPSIVARDIQTNEIVAIVGDSGCGKTTLMKIIAGLIPWTNGDVKINGKTFPPGFGSNKKTAEQRAAENALDLLKS